MSSYGIVDRILACSFVAGGIMPIVVALYTLAA